MTYANVGYYLIDRDSRYFERIIKIIHERTNIDGRMIDSQDDKELGKEMDYFMNSGMDNTTGNDVYNVIMTRM